MKHRLDDAKKHLEQLDGKLAKQGGEIADIKDSLSSKLSNLSLTLLEVVRRNLSQDLGEELREHLREELEDRHDRLEDDLREFLGARS